MSMLNGIFFLHHMVKDQQTACIGGTFQDAALRASQRGQRIYNCEDLFQWALDQKANSNAWQNFEFFKITEEDFQAAHDVIESRTAGLVAIQGTKSYHSFIPKDNNTIYCKEFSNQLTNTALSLHAKSHISCNKKRKSTV